MKLHIFASIALMVATSAVALEKATPGSCMAAVERAERKGNIWDAPFSKEECEKIAADMIDAGMMMQSDDPELQRRGKKMLERLYH